MGKLFAALAGWQGYVASAVLAALLATGATYYITSMGYRLTIAQMQRDKANDGLVAANNALKQFSSDAQAVHTAAIAFGTIQGELGSRLSTISRNFANAIKAHPLPGDCRPDAVRLRALSDAITATNTALGFRASPAVPASP